MHLAFIWWGLEDGHLQTTHEHMLDNELPDGTVLMWVTVTGWRAVVPNLYGSIPPFKDTRQVIPPLYMTNLPRPQIGEDHRCTPWQDIKVEALKSVLAKKRHSTLDQVDFVFRLGGLFLLVLLLWHYVGGAATSIHCELD